MTRIIRTLVFQGLALTAIVGASRAQAPVFTLREEARLGATADPNDDLTNIGGVTISPTGVVHVFQSAGWMSFSANGRPTRHVETTATLGLRRPFSFGWFGDTLWVVDRRAPGFALLDSVGRVVRRIPFVPSLTIAGPPDSARSGSQTASPPERRREENIAALLADGSILRVMDAPDASDTLPRATMRVIPGPIQPDTSTRPTAFLVRATPDGRVIEGIEVLSGPWTDARVPSPYGRLARIPQPFQDDPLVAVTPDGAEVVIVERYSAPRPGSAAYFVTRFDVKTRKRSTHRYEYQPVAVTDAAVDSAVARLIGGGEGTVAPQFLQSFPSPAAAIAAIRAAIRRPAYYTPVNEILVGADRTVWIRDARTGEWLGHASDGRISGRVVLGPRARLLAADNEHLWVAVPLDKGAPRSEALVRYRIARR